MSNKKVIFVFGRMNPPTVGHRALINKAIQTGQNMNAERLSPELIQRIYNTIRSPPSPPLKKRKTAK